MLEPDQSNDGLGEAGQQHWADEGTGHGAGKGEVVIGPGQLLVDVGYRCAVYKHIMGCLDVEGLFNFGIGGNDKMKQDQAGYQPGK